MKCQNSLKNAKMYKCEKMNNKMTQKFGEKNNNCENMEERKGKKARKEEVKRGSTLFGG